MGALDRVLRLPADVAALADKNLFFNGFMAVSQENSANAVTADNTYPADQWTLATGGASGLVFSGQRIANPFPSYPGIGVGVRLKVTTAKATLAAGDVIVLGQRIEGYRMAALGWGSSGALPMAIGIIVRPSLPLVAYLSIRSGDLGRSLVKRMQLVAGEDNFIPFAIDGDKSGSWATDATAGANISLCFGSGTQRIGTVDAWQAGSFMAGADVSNLGAAANNEVIISGIVALPGTQLPPKELWPLLARSVADELPLCQRYWEKGTLWTIIANTSGGTSLIVPFKVPKRAAPTITHTSLAGQASFADGGYTDTDKYRVSITGLGGSDFTWTASARL